MEDDDIIFQDSESQYEIPEPLTVNLETIFQVKTYIIEALLEIIADGLSIKEHHKLIFIKRVNSLFSSLYIQPSGTTTEVSKQVIMQMKSSIEEFMSRTIQNITHIDKHSSNNDLSIIPTSDVHLPIEILLKNLRSRFSEDFEVEENIGRGAYGTVLKVKKKTNKKKYAVKVITLRNSESDGRYGNREIERLMSLDHPNIVKFYDYWSEFSLQDPDNKSLENSDNSTSSELVPDGRFGSQKIINSLFKNVKVFIQMELCQTTLSHYLRHRSTLHHAHNWSLVRQLLSAVNYLHENQIVHRDLKPDNVLVNKDNSNYNTPLILKLTDFGLSRRLPERYSYTGSGVGGDANELDLNEGGDGDANELDLNEGGDGDANELDFNEGGDGDANELDFNEDGDGDGVDGYGDSYEEEESDDEDEFSSVETTSPFEDLTKDTQEKLKVAQDSSHKRSRQSLKPPKSLTISSHEKLTHDIGTKPFIAPEVMDQGGNYGFKVDVYAAGMISCKVFWLASTEQEMAVIMKSLKNGEMDEDEKCQNEVSLVKWLTQASPFDRPTASQALNSHFFQNKYIDTTPVSITSSNTLDITTFATITNQDLPTPISQQTSATNISNYSTKLKSSTSTKVECSTSTKFKSSTSAKVECLTPTKVECSTPTKVECSTSTTVECSTPTTVECSTPTNVECSTPTKVESSTSTKLLNPITNTTTTIATTTDRRKLSHKSDQTRYVCPRCSYVLPSVISTAIS